VRHVRWDLASKKVLTHWSEEVDHLGIFWEERFVLDPTGYDGDVARLNRPRLRTNT